MEEPRRLLLAGDTHGSTDQVEYLYDVALEQGCQAIVQLGDFGYFEHMASGVEFLKWTGFLAKTIGIPLLWLDGNHENHQLLRARYAPQPEPVLDCEIPEHTPHHSHGHDPTPEGFWVIREHLYYLPRGHRWQWQGLRFMALGGAYSIDKAWRVAEPQGEGTLWWPEEELTEAELARACDGPEVDILLTHDLPHGAEPDWLLPIPEAEPNRHRIRAAVEALRPRILYHGHYHARTSAWLQLPDGHHTVQVEGLANDGEGRRSWTVLDLEQASHWRWQR